MANHYDVKLRSNERAIHLPGTTYIVHKLAGQRFGRLVVLGVRASKADCLCDCGVRCDVRTGNLTQGATRSCGQHTLAWINEPIDEQLTDAQFIELRNNPKPLDQR